MEQLMKQWWGMSLVVGSSVLFICGILRLWPQWNEDRSAKTQEQKGEFLSPSSRSLSTTISKQEGTESLPPLTPDLGAVVQELGQKKGIAAWRKKNQAVAARNRVSEVIDAEIRASKKRIEYIRTVAEESSVIDEENLRIEKIRQDMERLELQDMVERKRLEKELEELERDVRILRTQPEVLSESVKPKTAEEWRTEALQREREKHEFDVEMKKQKAQQGLAARQALLAAKNEEIEKIRNNTTYTEEQKTQLIEDAEDYYDTLIDRTS